jgi:hypothetical protein
MFDEFMEELRRRQAEATGRRRPQSAADDEEPPINDDADSDPSSDARGDASTDDLDDETGVFEDDPEPEPIRPLGGRGPGVGGRPPRGPRGRRGVGGPGDGGPSIRRQVVLGIAIVLAVFVVVMAVAGLELWTDAIWYTSVGFGDVFFTRLRIQGVLFLIGAAGTLAILLFNL